MIAKFSKLSAPIAGAVLLVSAGLVAPASAAPQAGQLQIQTAQSELIVEVGQRGGHRGGEWGERRGGRHWDGRHGGRHHAMGPRQIRRSLRHRGFHRVRVLDRRGPMYIVKARGWNGNPMRLVVDARSGQIVRSRPIHRHTGWSFQYRW